MPNHVKSPDEVLLLCASVVMRFCYGLFRINPLATQFWPPLAAAVLSVVGFVHVSATIDPSYALVAAICALWIPMYWRDHVKLRVDSRKEWSSALFTLYGGKAVALRNAAAVVRLVILAMAAVATVVCSFDLLAELKDFEPWQRAIVPLNIWSLVWLSYSRSADLPPPYHGDPFARFQGAS